MNRINLSFVTVVLAWVLMLAPAAAFAQSGPNGILIFCGLTVTLSCDNNMAGGYSKLRNRYTAAGFPTTVTTGIGNIPLPTDLSPFKLIIISQPLVAFAPVEVDRIRAFLLSGGRLVFIASSSGTSTMSTSAANGNALMTALGVGMRFTGVSAGTCLAQILTGITPHALTTNISSVQSFCPASIDVGPSGTKLVGTMSAAVLAYEKYPGASAGGWIVGRADAGWLSNSVFDGSPFFGLVANYPGNIQFIDNLLGGPVCDIQMSQPTYGNGQTVTASVIRLINPGEAPVGVELKIWFMPPGELPYPVQRAGADGSFVLPARFDQNFGPTPLFSVTSSNTRGVYQFGCRLLSPLTGHEVSLDLNSFSIQ